jgi:hypothetical protein
MSTRIPEVTVTTRRDMLQIGACIAASAAMPVALAAEAGSLWNQL